MARTALEVSREEQKMYRPGMLIQQRTSEEQQHLAQRYNQAWQLANQAASFLRCKYGATRVIVFGSLTNSAWFNAWSDVDLAAWGIPPEQFYAAVAAVTGLSEHFKIDLVDPDNCRPDLRQTIENEGIDV